MAFLLTGNRRNRTACRNQGGRNEEIHILRIRRQRKNDHADIQLDGPRNTPCQQAERNRQQIQRRARPASQPRFQHKNRTNRIKNQHPARRASAGNRFAQAVSRRHRRTGKQRQRQTNRQLIHAKQTDKGRSQRGQQRPGRLPFPLGELGRHPLSEKTTARLPQRFGLHADERLLRADSGGQTRQLYQSNEYANRKRRTADHAMCPVAHLPFAVARLLNRRKDKNNGQQHPNQTVNRKHVSLTPPNIVDRPLQNRRNPLSDNPPRQTALFPAGEQYRWRIPSDRVQNR